jgi:hypothetical protein
MQGNSQQSGVDEPYRVGIGRVEAPQIGLLWQKMTPSQMPPFEAYGIA